MKIRLRKYKINDLERVCILFINEKVIQHLSVPYSAKDISRSDERKWLKKTIFAYRQKKPKEFNLAIEVDGEYVGSIGAHHIDYTNEKTEIGYWIGEPYWGKGIASHAIRKFVVLLFKKYNFKRIEALPYSYNIASQKVLEKAGFNYEGERRKAVKRYGKFYDDKIYAIVR